jgi:hypothetical protein
MAKVARHRTAFTVRLNQDDRELARWLGQYAHDHTMTKIVKLALYQFAGLEPPGTLAALASDAPRPAEDQAVTPDVIREILRSELSTTRLAPARREDPGGGEGDGGESPSGGIDMSPRRARSVPKAVHMPARIPEPALTAEDSARLLIASIRGYGRASLG